MIPGRTGAVMVLCLAALWLVGCSSVQKGDGPPIGEIDFDSIPDAVPKQEPRSRYGNPPSYEVFGKVYHTLGKSRGYVAQGVASWYGSKFHGERTSSGDRYDMYAMTAAHKTLPLPTYASVTNLENGRSVVVRINDRGPFHDDRVIDLSYVAAGKLRILGRGTALVEVRAIDPSRSEEPVFLRVADSTPSPPQPVRRSRVEASPKTTSVPQPPSAAEGASKKLYVQVGAFGSRENAERVRGRLLGAISQQVRISPSEAANPTLYRVQVGPLGDRQVAESLSQRLASLGLVGTQLIVD